MKILGVIVGVGAITSVGLRAIDTAFSHRAAAAGMREAPLLDGEGEAITMCFLPTLDPWLTGGARALALGTRALDESLESLGPLARGLRVRLGVSLDEHLAQLGPDGEAPATRLAEGLLARARIASPATELEIVTRGAAGPGYLLPSLADALASGTIDAAILGGVHSDYDPLRIAALSAAGRIFRPDNLDAMIPGEAAAFVVLMRPEKAIELGLPARAYLHAAATAYEKARPDNDESAFQAAGLTAVLRTALGTLDEQHLRAGWLLTDLTFETFRHYELQAATVRAQSYFCEPQHVDSPAQRMGHLGAAAMPLHLALAAEAYRRGFASHRYGVSIAGSDSGERAAVLFSGPA